MSTRVSVVNKLTTGLMDTFIQINQKYYFHNRIQSNVKRKQAQTAVSNVPYYNYHMNECLNNRYFIKSSIGKGSFGEVVLAWDQKSNKQVAIKIIRSGDLFLQQSQIEIQLYQLLQQNSDCDRQCLVFEQLHYNLFDILRFNNFIGLNIHNVQRIAYQLFHALRYIHNDSNRIIHCDVKPENILLTEHNGCNIKLIDFGSSSHSGSCIFSYIQSRYYRAPEVILGLSYSSCIDMWSVACVLFEMCTGTPLFRGRNELEQIILISELLGHPPIEMLIKGKKVDDFYIRTRIREDGNSRFILRRSPQVIPESMFKNPESLLLRVDPTTEEYELYYELIQLLRRLLVWQPEQRPTADEALSCRFFQIGHPTLSSEQVPGSSNDDPLVIQKSLVTTNLERSCESLSSCLQQDTIPDSIYPHTPTHLEVGEVHVISSLSTVNPDLILSPLLPVQHDAVDISNRGDEAEEADHHVERIRRHRNSRSLVDGPLHSVGKCNTPTGISSRTHKHRSISSSTLGRKDAYGVVSPYITSGSMSASPYTVTEDKSDSDKPIQPTRLSLQSLTPPNMSDGYHSVNTHSDLPETPLSHYLPRKLELTAEDYFTPSPSLSSFPQSELDKLKTPPLRFHDMCNRSGNRASFSPVLPLSIAHPPSFDNVVSCKDETHSTIVLSPFPISVVAKKSESGLSPFNLPFSLASKYSMGSSLQRRNQIGDYSGVNDGGNSPLSIKVNKNDGPPLKCIDSDSRCCMKRV